MFATGFMNDKRVLVVGLGRFGGGVGVTQWLAQQGAKVTVTDQAPAESLAASVDALAGLNVAFHLGGHDPRDLDRADLVIVNPAVDKRRSSYFREIAARGIPWTTELNLFCERCPAAVVGVTGTFGKSTTCAMLAAVLDAAVRDDAGRFTAAHLGGNIGRSLLGSLPAIRSTDVVVLELSSAQLEDVPLIRWAPRIAVITNVEPHHLDRYDGYPEYVRAKLNIIGPPDVTQAVVAGELHGDAEALLRGATGSGGSRLRRVRWPDPPVELRVPGRHNQLNAACVAAVCREWKVPEDIVRRALAEFPGLEHRLEFVKTIDGVDFFNDSKSTAPVTTVAACRSFDRPLVVLVGGQRKDVPLHECAAAIVERARAVICFGQAGPAFAESIRGTLSGRPELAVGTVAALPEAVDLARKKAKRGDAVLFSPGAPSFDAYPNYVDRGRHFAQLVNSLCASGGESK